MLICGSPASSRLFMLRPKSGLLMRVRFKCAHLLIYEATVLGCQLGYFSRFLLPISVQGRVVYPAFFTCFGTRCLLP
jgi:hypothetical protein